MSITINLLYVFVVAGLCVSSFAMLLALLSARDRNESEVQYAFIALCVCFISGVLFGVAISGQGSTANAPTNTEKATP